jgi:hypothetical protein
VETQTNDRSSAHGKAPFAERVEEGHPSNEGVKGQTVFARKIEMSRRSGSLDALLVTFSRPKGKMPWMRREEMSILTHKTDRMGRLRLPDDFAGCLVSIERRGDELRIRKVRLEAARRYSFKQLMAGVTKKNIHAEISTGSAIGGEAL